MKKYETYFKKFSIGSVLTIIALIILFIFNKGVSTYGEMILYETIPYIQAENTKWFLNTDNDNDNNNNENESAPVNHSLDNPVNDIDVINEIIEEPDLIGLDDILYQPETNSSEEGYMRKENLTLEDVLNINDIDYIKKSFYTIDKRTDLTYEQFDLDKILNTDLKINNGGDGPKILIFHTHSKEGYTDSDKNDINDGILLAGARLKQILENDYNIKTIHDTTSYDVMDGQTKISGAYERAEVSVNEILKKHPSIQIVIDMHRDGVPETTHLVKTLDDKRTAQIMFFNGLSRLYSDGVLTNLDELKNPYIDTNLALSFRLQLKANELYPDFTRKIYLNAYRYSLHMLPKSILVEVGAQTNTKEEALNAMEPLARILAETVL